MKKNAIGALVGGIILFMWQFLSFGPLGIHNSQMMYTPQQDQILESLESAGLTEGEYFLPRAPMGATSEDQQALFEQRGGKPWAQISYREKLNFSQGSNMFRGLIIDILSVFLLIWILSNVSVPSMLTSIKVSVAIGLIGYFTINYLDSIWFETSSIPNLVDAIVQWGLCGVWLGWWMNRAS